MQALRLISYFKRVVAMTKKEFKKIVQEGKDWAFKLWNEDYHLHQGKFQDYILRVFKDREGEAQEVLWEHERYGINESDQELHAYWKRSYMAHRAAIYYTRHLQREIAYIEREYLEILSNWSKEA